MGLVGDAEPGGAAGLTAVSGGGFFRSIVENANDMIVAFDDDGILVYVTPSCEGLLGMAPEAIVGNNIASFLHPDDLERALFAIGQAERHTTTLSNALFRLRHADGSWIPVDTTAGRATDGARSWFVAFCRFAASQQSESQTLVRLLRGAPMRDVLAPVLDSIAWQDLGSQMAITWYDDRARHHVSTGLTDSLCGVDDGGPWEEVRRSGQPVLRDDLSNLDELYRSQAAALGLCGYWIEPVSTSGYPEPALITVWTANGRAEPKIHEYGMATARRYVDVVLQFTAQRRLLAHAASHDALTGLANRKALVESLESADGGGALLFCDLDRFKPVNDEHGHAVGDELLVMVGKRLSACVRSGDLIARLGGDEFVVLCRDLDRAQTEELAMRIRAALLRPFAAGSRTIEIGVSIGIAHSASLGIWALDDADQAMYDAKSAGSGMVRWATDPGHDRR